MDGADARAGEHREHRLRDHRHIKNNAVALVDAEIAQHHGQHLGLGQQAVIGDGAFGAGKRRVVDDGGLIAAAGVDLAVDGVEAGVGDAAREPPAVNAGVWIKRRFGLFEPFDIGSRFSPKAQRIALPACVDLVVAARTGVHDFLHLLLTLRWPSIARPSKGEPGPLIL